MVARFAELWLTQGYRDYDFDEAVDQLTLLWANAIGLDANGGEPATGCATTTPRKRPSVAVSRRPLGARCQPVNTGRCSQPRTVEVWACTALSQSISHRGKRFKTSSSATRPSRRARWLPRQKWMP
jgi:hypothetical protein